ncbi:S8 family serine peptidase [Halomarina litorea]|uniref:S8 family serine peptidase n=1 Tax=Halomarina litorea TaxID=2961595 RepID=UPI0020C37ECE|nr:S8 family serine peptidase [Halomarina sp. BCD28]
MPTHNRRTFLKVSGAALGGMFATSGTVLAQESTDRFIVDLKDDRDPEGVDVVHDLSAVGLAVVEGTKSDAEKLGTVAPDLRLTLADPDVNREAPTVADAGVADEPLYHLQWDKQALDVTTAWETTKGAGTRVAIIDSGVDASHEDLEVNTELSRNFTGDGEGAGVPAGGDHGTHVAGIVGALDNETGIVGTAPETDLVDCRVFSADPGASFADILAAIVYSAEIDADVANLSLGAYPVPRQGLGSFYGEVLNSTMTYANEEGTLLVISAGNDSADLQHDLNFISLPNEGAQAVSVSATGPIGFMWGEDGLEAPPQSPAFYTNYGTNAITLGAPGGDADLSAIETGVNWFNDLVLSTVPGGYGWKAGTSMAAPNVAGAAALVKSANSSYDANQVESALKRAAEVPEGYDKAYYGAGFLNVVDAL